MHKSVLVSHNDCDGFGSVILAQYFNLPFDKIICCGYEDEEAVAPTLRSAENIAVADLSLSQDLYEELVSQGKTVRAFDHHETSRWISEKPGCVWDGSRCGTKIFFEEYVKPRAGRYKPVVREFVELVDVYDRWVLQSPLRAMSEDLQRVFVRTGDWEIEDALIRHDRFVTAMLRKLRKETRFVWNAHELMHIQKAKASEDKAYREALAMLQIRADGKGRKFGCFSAWGKISMTCHRMLNVDNMDVEYIVCVQTFHNKYGKVSLRSREGQFDLLELAGVSGHKASAGASLPPEDAMRFLREGLRFRYKTDLKSEDEPVIELVACPF